MAAAIVSFALSACVEKSAPIQADVVIPQGTDLMELEHYSYDVTFEIKSDSDWKIEFDFDKGQICYALPDQGTGSQTIKLCVIDNPGEDKRTGKMYIDFPKDETKNQVIDLQQKGLVANGMLGAVDLPLGNRVYVVGYGYNVLDQRASMNSVSMTPIIEISKANDDGRMAVGPMDASFVAKTYSGSSVSELSDALSPCFSDPQGERYYPLEKAQLSTFAPQGWRVPSSTDFLSIQKTLVANAVTQISTAKAFFPDADGGVLGFYHVHKGFYYNDILTSDGVGGYYGCLKTDSNKSDDRYFIIDSNESFGQGDVDWDDVFYYTVRLVQDIY